MREAKDRMSAIEQCEVQFDARTGFGLNVSRVTFPAVGLDFVGFHFSGADEEDSEERWFTFAQAQQLRGVLDKVLGPPPTSRSAG